MHFAGSGIDTPLKVSSIFGVICGVLLLSSLATFNLKLGPVDYSYPFTFTFFFSELLVVSYAILVIFGGLVALFRQMSIEQRGVLAFFVFVSSIFAIIGSVFFLSFVFGGPQ